MKIRASISIMLLISFLLALLRYVEIIWSGSSFESDLAVYENYYLTFEKLSFLSALATRYYQDIGFYSLFWLCSKTISYKLFLSFIILLFYASVSFLYFEIGRINKKIILPIILLGSFYFFAFNNLTENALRQGVAVSFLFLLNFFIKDVKIILELVKVTIGYLFHNSILFYVPVLLVYYIFNKVKYILLIWVISAILYITDIYLLLPNYFSFLPINIDVGALGIDSEGYNYGFSILKFIPSAFPITLLIIGQYKDRIFQNKKLTRMWKIYTIANAIGMSFSSYAYYDRILILSWILIPFLSVPLLELIFTNFKMIKTKRKFL